MKKLAENGTDFKLRVGSCYADCPDKFTDLGTECIKPDNINDYPPNKTTVWTPNYFGNYLVPQCGLTWENNKWIPHEGYTDCIKNNNGIPTYKVYKSRLMGCPGIDFAGAYQNKSRKNCENMCNQLLPNEIKDLKDSLNNDVIEKYNKCYRTGSEQWAMKLVPDTSCIN